MTLNQNIYVLLQIGQVLFDISIAQIESYISNVLPS